MRNVWACLKAPFGDLSTLTMQCLVDPDHASRLDGIVAALVAIGHGLIIEDQKMQTNAWR